MKPTLGRATQPTSGATPRRSLQRLTMAFAVCGALVLAGCSGSSSDKSTTGAHSSGAAHHGGDLVIARDIAAPSLDPTNTTFNEGIWSSEQIFQTLYTVAANGKDLKPLLAKNYKKSKDGKTYTFNLRHDVTFSTGKQMTSADVKFSIDKARKANGWGYLDDAIKHITTDGPHTVTFHLKQPWGPFLSDMSLFSNGIVPKNYSGKTHKAFYHHPVGTGPFKFESWKKGSKLKLVRNSHYWEKGKPYLNSITWTKVSDANTRQTKLKGGDVDIDRWPPNSMVSDLGHAPGINVKKFPSTGIHFLLMNHNLPQFKDVHVRRAVGYAVDRKTIVKSGLYGIGKPACSFLNPNVKYYDPKTPCEKHDVEKAKKELARSQYPDGFKVDFPIASGDSSQRTLGQLIQGQLKKIGIKVNLKQRDQDSIYNTYGANNKKWGIGFDPWTNDIPDPDEEVPNAVTKHYHSFHTNWSEPAKVDKWVKAAETTTDKAKRKKLYSKIQRTVAKAVPYVPLYYDTFVYATSDKVHGFNVLPTGAYHAEGIWMSH